MKIIRYLYRGNMVKMGYNEVNEEIAKNEADNGEYTVEDIEMDVPEVLPTTNDVLNVLLGVSV